MANEKKEKKGLTRAQKTEATKTIVKELLAVKFMRHNELIDEVAKIYTQRYEGEDTENVNDVKGRVGSVLDIMKKESEVMYDGGMYALKSRLPLPPKARTAEEAQEEKPVKKTAKGRAKKTAPVEGPKEEAKAEKAEAPTPKKRGRTKKEEPKTETTSAPVEEKISTEEAPAPKKRGRKPKAKEVAPAEEVPAPVEEKAVSVEETPAPAEEKQPPKEEKKELPVEEKPADKPVEDKPTEKPAQATEHTELVVKPKAELAQKSVMDMSFLFGDKTPKAAEPKTEKPTPAPVKTEKAPLPEKKEEKKPTPPAKAEKPAPAPTSVKAEKKEEKKETLTRALPRKLSVRKTVEKPMTAEEKLRDSYLKRIRTLGGDYFEYYSVYLLERYSMRNGRRLEGLRVCGGDHDGGIDGEIELTDKMGFKETIYIQSKNWDPEKGREESWIVGETLLQQFIGAVACRKAKEGKQHVRGIFVTTSRFTPDAKRILEDMSETIVGYDGNDLFEAAKECEFGIVKRNGEWVLDEKLLSGTKAFFQML